MSAPFVIVGMHRSGTSLVSRILDQSGVFMGLDLQEDHESRFFIELNKWIYENAGADWARPAALQELIDFQPAKKGVEEYLRSKISSKFSKKYSGKSLSNGLFDELKEANCIGSQILLEETGPATAKAVTKTLEEFF